MHEEQSFYTIWDGHEKSIVLAQHKASSSKEPKEHQIMSKMLFGLNQVIFSGWKSINETIISHLNPITDGGGGVDCTSCLENELRQNQF